MAKAPTAAELQTKEEELLAKEIELENREAAISNRETELDAGADRVNAKLVAELEKRLNQQSVSPAPMSGKKVRPAKFKTNFPFYFQLRSGGHEDINSAREGTPLTEVGSFNRGDWFGSDKALDIQFGQHRFRRLRKEEVKNLKAGDNAPATMLTVEYLNGMEVKELRKFAAEQTPPVDLALTGATKKSEIVQAIFLDMSTR